MSSVSDLVWDLSVKLLTAVGAVAVAWNLFRVAYFMLSTFVLPGKSLRSFGPKGSWAIVTGASDGIGKEYAKELLKADFNVLLVSRNADRLGAARDAIIAEIEASKSSRPVTGKMETFALDAETADEAVWQSFAEVVDAKGQNVAILINNVGRSHEMPVPFAETTVSEMKSIIDINCHATLRTTRIVLKNMVPRKNGLILTMASFASVFPTPLLATYCGSKGFLTEWSMALGVELAKHNITVDCVQSHMVVSKMSKVRKSLMAPTANMFVKSVLSKVGQPAGAIGMPYCSTPYWTHAAFQFIADSTLGRFSPVVAAVNYNMHENIRQRAIRKAAREKKL